MSFGGVKIYLDIKTYRQKESRFLLFPLFFAWLELLIVPKI